MASVSGSILQFLAPVGDTAPVNLVFTKDGTGATTIAGAYNIEIFTQTPGTLGPGFNAGAFIQGAQPVKGTTNELQAGSLSSTEQIFGGVEVIDTTGHETITASTSFTTIIGAAADTLISGSSGSTGNMFNAINPNESVVSGAGADTIFGGSGDTISGSAGATITSSELILDGNNMTVVLPLAGNDTVFAGTGDTITAPSGSANAILYGAAGDVINLSGNSGAMIINALTPGAETITAGSGGTTIFGGVGDSITAGASTYVDGTLGGMTIQAAPSGSDTIFGAEKGAPDTILGTGSAANSIIDAGPLGDSIDVSGMTGGSVVINDLNDTVGTSIKLGGGAASVFGGSGDSIALGNATTGQYVDGRLGKMTITGGKSTIAGAADDIVYGSTVAGAGDSVTGTRGSIELIYGAGTGNDTVNLAGTSGKAAINAIGTTTTVNDSIIAGNGANSVWGGGGDTIGIANGTTAAGIGLWGHSTTVSGATVAFGTFDTATGASYDTTTGTVTTLVGGSGASVTVGGAAGSSVGDFSPATTAGGKGDFLFYQGENATTDAAIVATASESGGNTTIVLPDGTSMVLFGVSKATLSAALAAGTLFK